MAPQFSREQRNFLVMEYHKQKGHRDFLPQLVTLFQNKFPGARAPSFSAIRRVYRKQMLNGTVNNCNSSTQFLRFLVSISGRRSHFREKSYFDDPH